MFITWAQFEIKTGRITDTGSTVFSHCPNPADADRAFADYAAERGYTEQIRHDTYINREWGDGLIAVGGYNDNHESRKAAANIRRAAVGVFTAINSIKA